MTTPPPGAILTKDEFKSYAGEKIYCVMQLSIDRARIDTRILDRSLITFYCHQAWNIDGDHHPTDFIFGNYWHAYAHHQRLKAREGKGK